MNCGGTDTAAAKWCSWEDLGRAALGKLNISKLEIATSSAKRLTHTEEFFHTQKVMVSCPRM